MAEAFILITCNKDHEDFILTNLKKIEKIQNLNKINGPYSIIIKMKGETHDEIKEIITSEIKTIDKICHTLTLKVKII
ncbi:MAG TPA: Lrp/AsnC ligand binding domain-containing protein [Nitrososphaeraceae archaeon]|nr:Lrp/AsnC ligand binding domain-containing protein [Nitrososphaeraceae archaeon]